MLTEEQLRILKEQAKRTADKYISDPRAKREIDERKRRRAEKRHEITDEDIPF